MRRFRPHHPGAFDPQLARQTPASEEPQMTLHQPTHGNHRAPFPRVSLTLGGLLAAVLVVATAGAARAQISSNWLDYTAIAKNKLEITSNLLLQGNFAVTEPGGRLHVGLNTEQDASMPDSYFASDEVELENNAVANNVYANKVKLD